MTRRQLISRALVAPLAATTLEKPTLMKAFGSVPRDRIMKIYLIGGEMLEVLAHDTSFSEIAETHRDGTVTKMGVLNFISTKGDVVGSAFLDRIQGIEDPLFERLKSTLL